MNKEDFPKYDIGDEVYFHDRRYLIRLGVVVAIQKSYDGQWLYDVIYTNRTPIAEPVQRIETLYQSQLTTDLRSAVILMELDKECHNHKKEEVKE